VHDLGVVGYYIKVFTAVFVLLNPIGAVPVFLSLTPGYTAQECNRAAWRAALATTLILLGALLIGGPVLSLFGISVDSFRVAGGLLIGLMALDMMRAQPSRTKQTPEEAREAIDKPDIAVVPLAIPILAGPGAISAMIVYGHARSDLVNYLVLAVIAVAAGFLSWLALRLAAPIGSRMGRTGVNLLTRIMGLLLAAIAVELIMTGLLSLIASQGGH
jgi:multiple antibiotic resistance protein